MHLSLNDARFIVCPAYGLGGAPSTSIYFDEMYAVPY